MTTIVNNDELFYRLVKDRVAMFEVDCGRKPKNLSELKINVGSCWKGPYLSKVEAINVELLFYYKNSNLYFREGFPRRGEHMPDHYAIISIINLILILVVVFVGVWKKLRSRK